MILNSILINCDLKATGRYTCLGSSLELPLHLGVIIIRLRSNGISLAYSVELYMYSSWRGKERLLLHCFRSNVENSSGPPEEFGEIVFIASLMSSLEIFMSERVLASGCSK